MSSKKGNRPHLTAFQKARIDTDLKILAWVEKQTGQTTAIVDAAHEKFNVSVSVVYRILRWNRQGRYNKRIYA